MKFFECLFIIERLMSFFNDLKLCCKHFEIRLIYDNSYDLSGKYLFEMIKIIRMILTIESKLNFVIELLEVFNCFPLF